MEIILDQSQVKPGGQYCPAKFFFDAGIPVYIDSAHQIAHNKILTIDRSTVITGSFNFTRTSEEKNAENLLVIIQGTGGKILVELAEAQAALRKIRGETIDGSST